MFDVFYPLTKRSDRQSYRNPKPPRSKKPRKEEKENKNFTYVYPVQSSTWFDPWLTATTSHSAHWSAERSMADVFSYNPSKTQFLDLSKRNPHRVQFSFSNRFASDFTRNPTLSIDCVCVCLGRHTTTPIISKFDTVLYPTNERSSIHTLKHAQITGGVSKF